MNRGLIPVEGATPMLLAGRPERQYEGYRLRHFVKLASADNVRYLAVEQLTSTLSFPNKLTVQRWLSQEQGLSSQFALVLGPPKHPKELFQVYGFNAEGCIVPIAMNGLRCAAWAAKAFSLWPTASWKLRCASSNETYQVKLQGQNVSLQGVSTGSPLHVTGERVQLTLELQNKLKSELDAKLMNLTAVNVAGSSILVMLLRTNALSKLQKCIQNGFKGECWMVAASAEENWVILPESVVASESFVDLVLSQVAGKFGLQGRFYCPQLQLTYTISEGIINEIWSTVSPIARGFLYE